MDVFYLKISHLVLQFLFQGTARKMLNKIIFGWLDLKDPTTQELNNNIFKK